MVLKIMYLFEIVLLVGIFIWFERVKCCFMIGYKGMFESVCFFIKKSKILIVI